jgi:hypothetical protein
VSGEKKELCSYFVPLKEVWRNNHSALQLFNSVRIFSAHRHCRDDIERDSPAKKNRAFELPHQQLLMTFIVLCIAECFGYYLQVNYMKAEKHNKQG